MFKLVPPLTTYCSLTLVKCQLLGNSILLPSLFCPYDQSYFPIPAAAVAIIAITMMNTAMTPKTAQIIIQALQQGSNPFFFSCSGGGAEAIGVASAGCGTSVATIFGCGATPSAGYATYMGIIAYCYIGYAGCYCMLYTGYYCIGYTGCYCIG